MLEDQQKQNELSKEIAEILSENAKIDAELEEKEKRRISAKIPVRRKFNPKLKLFIEWGCL